MRTEPEHFETFKQECLYWIDFLNLGGWRMFFEHSDNPINKTWAAWTRTDYADRTFTIGLAVNWGKAPITNFELCRNAFHEVFEVLMSDVGSIAKMDQCPSQLTELEKSIHLVIRTMENCLWEPDYLRRTTHD